MNTRSVKNFVGVLVGAVMVSGAWAQTPPGVTISETRLNLTEEGTSGSYTVRLDTQPTGNVTITISSNNGEVTTNPSALTFSNSDWDTAQTVTVNAGSDADSMNDSAQLSHTVSGYGNVMAAAVAVAIADDEAVGICGRTQQVRDAIVRDVNMRRGTHLGCNLIQSGDLVLAEITRLSFVHSMITTLQAGDFDGLPALTSLILGSNQLSSLPAGVFDQLTALTSLNLGSNQISSLPAGIFDQLTALTSLELRSNQLNSLPTGVFDQLTSLRTLILLDNQLSSLPAGVFDGLTALTNLELEINRLSSLPAGVFDDLTALTRLDLESNRLSSLPAEVFDQLTALTELSLGRNRLSSLPDGLFANLPSLENLWLFDNQLSSLPAFTRSTRLFTLRLNNNQLRSLPRNAFSGLTGLGLLHLQGNPISLPLTVSLVRVGATQARARIHTGAPFPMNFPVTVTNGTFAGGTTTLTLTIARGGIESQVFTVIPSAGVTSVDLGRLPSLPTTSAFGIPVDTRDHLGYELVRSSGNLPLRFSQAGLDVIPTALTIAEEAADTYTVSLSTQPTGDVTVTVTSSSADVTVDTDSAIGNQNMLTFTMGNWVTPQTVTVTVAPDDNAMSETVTLSHTVSSGYGSLNMPNVTVTVADNDVPSVVITPTRFSVTEGESEEYTVVLNTPPAGDVMVTVTSDNTDVSVGADPTPQTRTLILTMGNWDTAQTVTVSAAEDTDGMSDIAMLTHEVSGFGAVTAPTVTVTVNDNDANVTVDPALVTVTEEDSSGGTYTVVLEADPVGNVTIQINSDDTSVTPSPSALTFTGSTWNTPQTVTVRAGADDDGNDNTATLSHSVFGYGAAIIPPDVMVMVDDNDTPGITTNPNTGLTTGEDGTMATFTVVLDTEPTAVVTVSLSSSDAGEGTAAPDALTFATDAWNTAQTVTVTGVNDAIADGNQDYMVTLVPSSGDTSYDGLTSVTVSVTNNDDTDAAGVTADPSTGLTTGEGGTTATFTVVLNSEPTAVVTISLSSSDDTEGTVPDALTFATDTWSTAQTVTVTGVDDAIADGDVGYTVTLDPSSTDGGYDGLSSVTVSVTNNDDTDTAGVIVDTDSVTAGPQNTGLTTTEAGTTDTFTVVLNSEPTHPVTISLESSDTGEGTVPPDALTFATDAWNTAQTVTVTGQNDAIADGNQSYMITLDPSSTDTNYDGLSSVTVSVTNEDDDTAGVTANPNAGLITKEDPDAADRNATFTVVLDSEPTHPVAISVSSSDAGEGTVPDALTFATDAWNTAQTVTVTGQNDAIADGNQSYMITLDPSSTDTNYDGLSSVTVSVTNEDDDTAGVTADPDTGLTTGEDGTTATFTVVLDSEPTHPVAISVSSSDAGEGTAAPDALTFATDAWNTAQTVTVTGQNDAIADGNQSYMITLDPSSTDTNYDGLSSVTVSVTNEDDDTAGVTADPDTGLTTGEDGTTATFTVVLDSEPTHPVAISVSSSDAGEGTVPDALTFATDAWDTAQTVTVTGVDDDVADGDVGYTITLDPSSTDTNYDGLSSVTVSVTNTDDDTAGITADPSTGLTTKEDPGAADRNATFTVVLDSEPTHPVAISVSSSDAGEGTVPDALTFATDAWDTAQTVTVTGVDDDVADGDVGYTITLDPSSTDTNYDGLSSVTVSVTNTDDDTAGITADPSTGLTTKEDPGAADRNATFTVVLDSEPTHPVAISVSSSDAGEGTVPDALTFATDAWNTAQTVTVTGVDDDVADGDVGYTITLDPSSTDTNYDGLSSVTVSVTNTDDDTAGITADPSTGLTTKEDPGAADRNATFTVVLDSEPTHPVAISVSSSDAGEGTVPDALTFATDAWDTAQTVTVTGVDDDVADGDVGYTITLDPSSTDTNYDGLSSVTVSVTNTDDDTAGITADPSTSLTTKEDPGAADRNATFTVVLDSEPTHPVAISVSSSDAGEGTVPDALTFATDAWDTVQTVTVTGVDDDVADGDVGYTITLDPSSTDTNYDGLSSVTVSITNEDDDAAGVIISQTSLSLDEGTSGNYTVNLNTQPTGNVMIDISSSNGEVTTNPSALTFTDGNWAMNQTVTVIAAEDGDALNDTAILSHIVSGYGSVDRADDVTVVVTDLSDIPEATADVNGDRYITAEDALLLFYIYRFESSPGVRNTLLMRRLGNDTDEVNKAIMRATAWKRSSGGDLNLDGDVDAQDALIMYFAYEFEDLNLAREHVTLRELLLNGLGTGTDSSYKQWLLSAQQLRED